MASNTAHSLDEIDDPGEYNQRRRIRAIHDARERVLNQRRHAKDLKATGMITTQDYESILREAVGSFVIEIEQLLRRYQHTHDPDTTNTETEAEPDSHHPPSWYLNDAPLGTVTIPPDGTIHKFTGLQSVIEFPDPHTVTWETSQTPPAGFSTHPDNNTTTHQREVQIPEPVLMKAVRVGMQFLNTIGMDAEIEDSLPTIGFREVKEEDLEDLTDGEVMVDDRA